MSWDLRLAICLASWLRSLRPIVSSSWAHFCIFWGICHLPSGFPPASDLLDVLQLVRHAACTHCHIPASLYITCLPRRFGS